MVDVSAPPPTKNRRALKRAPSALRAKLFPGAVDCLIRDHSKLGARLSFRSPPPLGRRFLVVSQGSGLAYEVESRWRSGSEMGVRFRESWDLSRDELPPHLAEIAALRRGGAPRAARMTLARWFRGLTLGITSDS
jgi:hypothetical protein